MRTFPFYVAVFAFAALFFGQRAKFLYLGVYNFLFFGTTEYRFRPKPTETNSV